MPGRPHSASVLTPRQAPRLQSGWAGVFRAEAGARCMQGAGGRSGRHSRGHRRGVGALGSMERNWQRSGLVSWL